MGMDLDTGGPKRSVRPVMNVAPLVDVVLVLLIIFMVITPLLTKQMSVTVPVKPDEALAAAPPDPDAEPQVVMWVGSDGRARINKDVVADAELGRRLQQIFAARRDQTLFYDSHDTVAFGRTVQLIDIARGVGIATIAPLPEPLADLE